MVWQPMETAPQGQPVLLWLPTKLDTSDCVGWCGFDKTHVVLGWQDMALRGRPAWECCFMEDGAADTEGFCDQFYMIVKPSHWHPLPDPPTEAQ